MVFMTQLQNKVISSLLEYREAQQAELNKGASCGITLGDVTTVNVSYLKVRPTPSHAAYDSGGCNGE